MGERADVPFMAYGLALWPAARRARVDKGNSLRLLIVDCHPVLREGLIQAARAAFPEVIADCADSMAAALTDDGPGKDDPHLVIISFDLPDAQGLSLITQLQQRYADAAILLLSEQPGAALIAAARKLGAAGWLDTLWSIDNVAEGLRAVLSGSQVFPRGRMDEPSEAGSVHEIGHLSNAQLRVIMALSSGCSNKQIAYDLGITEATVKAHLSASFRKLGVRNRAQALLAIRRAAASSQPS